MKNKIFVSLIFLAANASAYTIQGSLLVTSSATVNNGMTVGGQETVVSTLTVKGSAFSVGASAFFVTPGGTVGMNTATPNTAYVFHDNGSALVSGQLIVIGTTTIMGSGFSVGGSTLVVSGGQVGIGHAVTSTAQLEVQGQVTAGSVDEILEPLSGGTSAYLQFTDQATYNFGIGTDANGSFNLYSGRNPTTVGTNRMTVLTGGNVGIGTASPCSTCTLHVAGTLSVTGQTNILTRGTVTNIGGQTSTSASFAGCVSNSTITIVTNGSPVYVSYAGDASNTTLLDGCFLWILQDGAYINSSNATTPNAVIISATANAYSMMNYAQYISAAPAAGSHNYCIGIGIRTGGTCQIGQIVPVTFSVGEVR